MQAIGWKLLPLPARPAGQADLDVDRTCVVVEPEGGSQVVLRQKAPAGTDLTELLSAAAGDRHLCADRESIAGRRYGPHRHPVVLRRLPILEQRRRVVDVADDEVEIAVVVEIPHGKPAADARELESGASAIRDVAEPVTKVQQQLVLLSIGFAQLRILIDVRENVPVREKQIELPVEVGIKERGAPSHAGECRGSDPRCRVFASSN